MKFNVVATQNMELYIKDHDLLQMIRDRFQLLSKSKFIGGVLHDWNKYQWVKSSNQNPDDDFYKLIIDQQNAYNALAKALGLQNAYI